MLKMVLIRYFPILLSFEDAVQPAGEQDSEAEDEESANSLQTNGNTPTHRIQSFSLVLKPIAVLFYCFCNKK